MKSSCEIPWFSLTLANLYCALKRQKANWQSKRETIFLENINKREKLGAPIFKKCAKRETVRHDGRIISRKVCPWQFFCAICPMAQLKCIPVVYLLPYVMLTVAKKTALCLLVTAFMFKRRKTNRIGGLYFIIIYVC